MQMAGDGDMQAFEVLFDRHSEAAFSLAYRICGQRALAQNVVHEASLWLWRSAASYDRTRGSVRSWLLTAVHSRAVDASRLNPAVESERLPDQRTQTALTQLPDDERRALELAYFGGLTISELSSLLQLPTSEVKDRLGRGLSKLRSGGGSVPSSA